MGALYDLVGFSTTTTGTGTITAGTALPGHLTLAGAGIPDGTTVSYGISSANGSAREVGNGVVGGSGTTLTRVLSSSSTGSLLNLSGTSEVIVTALAADFDIGATTAAASSKATPVDADGLPISDSAASGVLKKLTWANLKATLKAYFDTLYATAAQGTDAREWTAATVDQAEAEAGAATTRRAWTAQRVAQAIAAQVAAWWTSLSTAAGRALVTAADAAAQRTALGLGTAATTAASAYATSAQGVPAGGATGQVLAKTSATDYAVAWTTASGGDSRSTTLTFTNSITPATLLQWQYAGYGIGSNANGETLIRINSSNRVWMGNTGVRVSANVPNSGIAWTTSEDMLSSTVLAIVRDADNVAAQRNGTNAQERRTYGTYTDASNYRRLSHGMSTAGVAHIRPEGAGTGASGNVLHISGLPTSNPGPGILWNDAGTVKVGT